MYLAMYHDGPMVLEIALYRTMHVTTSWVGFQELVLRRIKSSYLVLLVFYLVCPKLITP